jgi:hypothetical protein
MGLHRLVNGGPLRGPPGRLAPCVHPRFFPLPSRFP